MIIAVFVLSALVVLMIIYLIRMRFAVQNLAKQLMDLSGKNTNQLLRNTGGQKMLVPLVNSINAELKELRENTLKAEQMNREIRESLTEISHDLRTPLTAAGGYTSLLRKAELTDEEKIRYINVIEERFETTKNLVDQLFYYARMESGALTLAEEEVDVRRVLTDVLAMYYGDFEKKHFDMNVDIEDRAMPVMGDRDAFTRVFSNIVSNGLSHGEGDFSLSLKIDQGTGVFRLIFSNLATNIAEADAEKLFDKYFTKDHVRSSSNTGLGLAIAKNLTERMHGSCSAHKDGAKLIIMVEYPLI